MKPLLNLFLIGGLEWLKFIGNFYWDLGLKMRTLARSLRHIRLSLQHKKCNYSGGFVNTRKDLIETNTGSVCKFTNNAEFNRFRYLTFTISRAMSADAAKVTNGGCFWFLVIINWIFIPLYEQNCIELWLNFSLFLVDDFGYFWLNCRCEWSRASSWVWTKNCCWRTCGWR